MTSKSRVTLFLLFLICIFSMTACAATGHTGDNVSGNGKINVICTTFPLYDWTRQIAGENANVKLLLDNGVDMHSFQASATDVADILSCDVLVFVGGSSDQWITDALKNKSNPDMQVVNLMAELSEYVKEEEHVEGMQQEEHHEVPRHEESDHEEEMDEHIWLSVRNAMVSCGFIKDALCTADSDNSSQYENACEQYVAKLDLLDKEYENTVSSAKRKTLLFADRFPFRYLMDDYGISYYAAFPGCSSETNASFQTVTFLAGKLDEEKLPAVLVLENAESGFAGELAKTVIDNSSSKNQKILMLDSMQAVSQKQLEENISYVSVMQANRQIISEALN